MVSVKVASLVGAVALFASAAQTARAADMPMPIPPPIADVVASGWDRHGDNGMTKQSVRKMHQRLEDVVSETFDYRSKPFDGSPLFGLGIGYQFNNWLRFDVTGEYR